MENKIVHPKLGEFIEAVSYTHLGLFKKLQFAARAGFYQPAARDVQS